MAEYNPHPIPGFIVDLDTSDIYRSHEVGPGLRALYGAPNGTSQLGRVHADDRLSALLTEAADSEGYGDTTAHIDPDTDLVYFENADADSFDVQNSATAIVLGFRNFPVSAVVVGDKTRAYATADWQRGDFEADPISLLMGGPGGDLVATRPVGHVQHLMAWQYASGGGGGSDDFRFGLTTNGHLFLSTQESPIPISFTTSELLGFDGTEVGTTGDSGTWTTFVANHPCAGVWVPSRPLARRIQRTELETTTNQSLSGAFFSVRRGAFPFLRLEAWLDGPMDRKDLQYQLLDWFAPYAYPGAPISFYPRWGDPREGIRQRVAAGFPFSFTTQTYQNGEHGVVTGYLTDAMATYVADWPEDLRRRAPITIEMSVGS